MSTADCITPNTCITGNPVTVSFTYSTCTRTLNIGPIPDSEGDVPGYCGFGCGSVQSYFVQRNNASAPSTCSYFVAISII